MRVGILSEFCLAGSHGSGAQMLRIIDHARLDYFHLYWSQRPFGLSEKGRHSHLFEDPLFWRPLRLNRAVAKLHAAVGLRGWHGDTLNVSLFNRLLPPARLRCDVLHAFATSESSAARCLSLIDHLRKPFVLHVMDVQHENGLDPATTPRFVGLIRRASSVLTINDAIAAEVRRFPVQRVEVVPFGQAVDDLPPRAALPADAPRVFITGAIHHGGLDLLTRVWPSVLEMFPCAELVYTGTQFDKFPSRLQPHVKNLGFVEPARYLETLRASHVGYVPGPVELNCYGRFSIPSRIADFFMAALPVIACVAPDSAAEQFLRPLLPERFVQIPRDADELVNQFAHWLGDEPRRAAAGAAARRYAETHLSSAGVAQTVVAHLRAACTLPTTVAPTPCG